ncbi:MAG: aldo/keto reductase [Kiritimatiellia bacterium]
MKKTKIGQTDLEVSEFCLGTMPYGVKISGDEVDTLIDSFRGEGGNFFDAAHCYSFWAPCGDGASERALGRYMKKNGCRDSMVIATKGGHPGSGNYRKVERYLSPCRVEADIDDSLGRLGIDVIDLYWLHRDDPREDVGAILDTLNNEVKRGRIRYFGGSNWTAARLDEANTYAAKHGIDGFVASQSRWSLLRYEEMSDEERLKPGALLSVNGDDRRRHADSQLPLVPYGPTGNGFFAMEGRAPEKFITPGNTERANRVVKLASELGATPGQVPLAWLKAQPFPVIPILGTSSVEHLKDALGAADVNLTRAQVTWLEKGE